MQNIPLKPKDPKKGAKVYADIVEYINTKRFHVESMITYDRSLPQEILNGTIDPLFYEERAAMGRSVATISTMIDMSHNGVRWKLLNKFDVFVIKEYVDMYLTELYRFKETKVAADYLEKMVIFQTELTGNCRKLLSSDKELQRDYVKKNAFELIMGQGAFADSISEKYRVVAAE